MYLYVPNANWSSGLLNPYPNDTRKELAKHMSKHKVTQSWAGPFERHLVYYICCARETAKTINKIHLLIQKNKKKTFLSTRS